MKKVISVGIDEDIYEWLNRERESYLKINVSALVNHMLREFMVRTKPTKCAKEETQ